MKDEQFVCYICEKTFKRTRVIRHYHEIEGDDNTVSLCDKCADITIYIAKRKRLTGRLNPEFWKKI